MILKFEYNINLKENNNKVSDVLFRVNTVTNLMARGTRVINFSLPANNFSSCQELELQVNFAAPVQKSWLRPCAEGCAPMPDPR